MKRFLLVFVMAVLGRAGCSTIIEIEKPKKLTPTGSLSTCGYTPAAGEQTFFSKVGQKELVTGSFLEPYSIKRQDRQIRELVCYCSRHQQRRKVAESATFASRTKVF